MELLPRDAASSIESTPANDERREHALRSHGVLSSVSIHHAETFSGTTSNGGIRA
jgi:hypothetical protein